MINTNTDNWKQVEGQCQDILGEDIVAYINRCHADPEPAGKLIAVLHKVQDKFGYLGPEQLDAVSQLLRVPTAKVSGVASFYHFFRLEPRGKYVINLCLGTACYVKGADQLAAKLRDELGITFGETSTDGNFTLEGTRCLGTCGLAPVMMINDEVHAEVTPEEIPVIINEYIKKAKADEK